jgi:hypothetical protein
MAFQNKVGAVAPVEKLGNEKELLTNVIITNQFCQLCVVNLNVVSCNKTNIC